MPLCRYAFFIKAPGFSPERERTIFRVPGFEAYIFGLSDISEALELACHMRASGVQMVELCGAFSPSEAQKLRDTFEPDIVIGNYRYTPEEEAHFSRIFA